MHCPLDSLGEATRNLMSELATSQKAIIVIFQPATEMIGWDFIEQAKGLIIAQNNSELAQSLSAQLIFGGVGAKGRIGDGNHGEIHKGNRFGNQRNPTE